MARIAALCPWRRRVGRRQYRRLSDEQFQEEYGAYARPSDDDDELPWVDPPEPPTFTGASLYQQWATEDRCAS